jgi:hypothetical protein
MFRRPATSDGVVPAYSRRGVAARRALIAAALGAVHPSDPAHAGPGPRRLSDPPPLEGPPSRGYDGLLLDALALFELLTPDARVVVAGSRPGQWVQAFPVLLVLAEASVESRHWGLFAVPELQVQPQAGDTRGALLVRGTLGVGSRGLGGYLEMGGLYGGQGLAGTVGLGVHALQLTRFGVSAGWRVDLGAVGGGDWRHTVGVSLDFPLRWLLDE